MDREAFDAACNADTTESRHALFAFGPFDRWAFAFTAWFNGQTPGMQTERPANHAWPRHHPMTRPLRHAIFVEPIVQDIQNAAADAVTDEQAEAFKTTLQSEVERLEAEGPAND